VGKNLLDTTRHLGSAQLIKFDIWVASRRVLDGLRKATTAIIISLCVEEPTFIFFQTASHSLFPACIIINPSAVLLSPLASPQTRANYTVIHTPSCQDRIGNYFLGALD
jgi:hypothetical protein